MRIAIKAVGIAGIILGLCTPGVYAQEEAAPRPVTPPGALPSVLGSPTISNNSQVTLTSGTYAVFHTSEGDFVAELKEDIAPQTVRNFMAYATGKKSWRHPVTMDETTRPLYSNTNIYRTISNAMIYGGDPLNRGEGDSGTQLPLEARRDVQFDQPGLLAMDSSGDKMSGSRWFITLRPFPERTGNYTIFGEVIGGLDLVQRISQKPVKRPQLPLDPVMVYFIEIVTVPAGRITTGEFRMENGMTVLRIDPDFKDAPPEAAPPSPTPADFPTTITDEMLDSGELEDAEDDEESEGSTN